MEFSVKERTKLNPYHIVDLIKFCLAEARRASSHGQLALSGVGRILHGTPGRQKFHCKTSALAERTVGCDRRKALSGNQLPTEKEQRFIVSTTLTSTKTKCSGLVVDEDVDDVEEGGLYVAEEFRHLLTNRLQPKARLDPTLPATQRRTGYEVVLWNPIRPLIIPVDEKPAEDDDTVHLPQSSGQPPPPEGNDESMEIVF
ncbi:hypothetical protein M514_18583 [Trichuris suis]|uniref:Uncharacterized protein n=1 Tax=Trichuris suis TaxID=68888 RepID=A0A085NIB8_9BILA|nr:hypothetical protein M514_18583 [Trichuris suis]